MVSTINTDHFMHMTDYTVALMVSYYGNNLSGTIWFYNSCDCEILMNSWSARMINPPHPIGVCMENLHIS